MDPRAPGPQRRDTKGGTAAADDVYLDIHRLPNQIAMDLIQEDPKQRRWESMDVYLDAHPQPPRITMDSTGHLES